jgi:hypothetical protein
MLRILVAAGGHLRIGNNKLGNDGRIYKSMHKLYNFKEYYCPFNPANQAVFPGGYALRIKINRLKSYFIYDLVLFANCKQGFTFNSFIPAKMF